MKTILTISLIAGMLTLMLSSCGGEAATDGTEKELVYEGSMAEPQIGAQYVAEVHADSTAVSK